MEITDKEAGPSRTELRDMVKEVFQQFLREEQTRAEPAYKAELVEERNRREQLETRINQLVEENRRSKQVADELERASTIRAELQRLGVSKLDLAFRAVKEDIVRTEHGRLVANTPRGEVNFKEYLAQFVTENPELLPARIGGGSGAGAGRAALPLSEPTVDIDKIRPGMTQEEREKIRQEIARVTSREMRME